MIIPVKCFTCGNVLANKYRFYLKEVRKQKVGLPIEQVNYLTADNMDKSIEGEILDKMYIHKICCRRHMLTHVDIM